MAIYFFADPHFDDEDIRRYENRPFTTVQEMNETIISNWNKLVLPKDTVYLLGDIGADLYIPRLNGIKYLIKGNHDTASNFHYREIGFQEVYDLPVIFNEYWMLSHEPLYINRNMPYANIFGHVHNNPAYKTISSRSFCVSAERIGYTPVSLEHIRAAILEAQRQEDTSL